ncbi:MAG: hypothetical protein ACE5J5_08210 [Candidatus Hydrothermarchaeales archaeon]
MKFSNNIKGWEDEASGDKTAEITVDPSWLDYFVPLDIKLSQKKQITLILDPEEFEQLHREVNKCAKAKKPTNAT